MSDTDWTRSSFWRDGDACIEVRRDGDMVLVRDGDLGDDSREMVWSLGGWRDLIDALVNGEDSLWVIPANDRGGVHFGVGDSLHFEEGAWNSFVAGVKAGEFDPDRLSTPVPVSEGSQVSGEVGPGGNGPNLAATGAGNGPGGVVPVPVAARVTATAIRQALYDSLSPNFEIDSDAYDDAAVAVALLLEPQLRWGSGALVDHNPETPQRWEVGAPQPGRSVTAVRDIDGDLWDRMFGDVGERLDAWTASDDREITISWGELLSEFGPLTDATCDTCDGKGVIACYGSYPGGPTACIDCHNTGEMPCSDCPGTGSADPDGGQR